MGEPETAVQTIIDERDGPTHGLDPHPKHPLKRTGIALSESQRKLIEDHISSGDLHKAQTEVINILDSQSHQDLWDYPPISTLSQSESISILRKISNAAMLAGDLSLVFANNGKSGRSASGNYSLIAKATGLSRAHVGKVLKGDSGVSLRALKRISEASNIDVDDIVRYIDEQGKSK